MNEDIVVENGIVRLKGSDEWISGYEVGQKLEDIFGNQECRDFAYACSENQDWGPLSSHGAPGIVGLLNVQEGENDGDSWIWLVKVQNGATFEHYWVHGWCDYTGWDCQSSVEWTLADPDGEFS